MDIKSRSVTTYVNIGCPELWYSLVSWLWCQIIKHPYTPMKRRKDDRARPILTAITNAKSSDSPERRCRSSTFLFRRGGEARENTEQGD